MSVNKQLSLHRNNNENPSMQPAVKGETAVSILDVIVYGTKFHGTKMCRTFVARGQGKYEDENVLDLKVQV